MGIGVLIVQGTNQIASLSNYVPPNEVNTNNLAEYLALWRGLEYLVEEDLIDKPILIQGDSALVVNQMNRLWGFRSRGGYARIAMKCMEILRGRNNITIEWIPRDMNQMADMLSTQALPIGI